MKLNLLPTTLLVFSSVAFGGEQLHPADAYDIASAAKYAATENLVKAGTPVKKGETYKVAVTVGGKKCTVVVKPYVPTKIEPPIRWKADKTVCDK